MGERAGRAEPGRAGPRGGVGARVASRGSRGRESPTRASSGVGRCQCELLERPPPPLPVPRPARLARCWTSTALAWPTATRAWPRSSSTSPRRTTPSDWVSPPPACPPGLAVCSQPVGHAGLAPGKPAPAMQLGAPFFGRLAPPACPPLCGQPGGLLVKGLGPGALTLPPHAFCYAALLCAACRRPLLHRLGANAVQHAVEGDCAAGGPRHAGEGGRAGGRAGGRGQAGGRVVSARGRAGARGPEK